MVKDTFEEPIMNKEMRVENGNHANVIVEHAVNDKNVDVTVDLAQHHEIPKTLNNQTSPRIVEKTSDIPVVHERDRHLEKNPSSMSPFLFLIVVEGLSGLMNKAVGSGSFHGY
ncbi:hypothetical protein L195_g044466 [Trifolium pratense]|uniref:Uncharacterized protein n=1 Tax=Trifolium pratense TaxID=57577 RepID=A0A2K3MC60_TRIPR|nr:hypothetical protein L195_g044466 [Trifolium pratense]